MTVRRRYRRRQSHGVDRRHHQSALQSAPNGIDRRYNQLIIRCIRYKSDGAIGSGAVRYFKLGSVLLAGKDADFEGGVRARSALMASSTVSAVAGLRPCGGVRALRVYRRCGAVRRGRRGRLRGCPSPRSRCRPRRRWPSMPTGRGSARRAREAEKGAGVEGELTEVLRYHCYHAGVVGARRHFAEYHLVALHEGSTPKMP